jgi:hypothetical protein
MDTINISVNKRDFAPGSGSAKVIAEGPDAENHRQHGHADGDHRVVSAAALVRREP